MEERNIHTIRTEFDKLELNDKDAFTLKFQRIGNRLIARITVKRSFIKELDAKGLMGDMDKISHFLWLIDQDVKKHNKL